MKLQAGNLGKFHDIGLGKFLFFVCCFLFFGYDPKNKCNKSKNRQKEVQQTKKKDSAQQKKKKNRKKK
jgi:hypothetical protein